MYMSIFIFEKHKVSNNRRTIHKQKGFTLIELLVVISIIAFLSSIVMSSLQSSRLKAEDAQIKSDMTQIRSALELYSNDNNYLYPTVLTLVSKDSTSSSAVATSGIVPTGNTNVQPIISRLASLVTIKEVSAEGSRDQNCTYFDNLASLLVPKYIGSIPRHPLDNGTDVCYRYFASASGDHAVAYGSLITETYSNGLNKQAGITLGKTDETSLQDICNENLNSGSGLGPGALPFPLFSGGANQCSGTSVADEVIGVTSGNGDVVIVFSCSDPQYGDQTSCESEHSYCSDPQYTNSTDCESNGGTSQGTCSNPSYTDQSSCESAGSMSGQGCSDPQYSDESSCLGAGYYSGGGCTGGGYSDQSSCIGAGYDNGSCSGYGYYDPSSCTSAGYYSGGGCSNGSYYDQSSCVNAGYSSGGGYCSNSGYYDQTSCEGAGTYNMAYCSGGGYYDQYSCENAGYSSGYCSGGGYSDQSSCESAACSTNPAYCSDGVSTDPDTCANNGYSWYGETQNSCGYYWTAGSSGYGYTWYPDSFASYGYTWYPETFTSYGYTWGDSTYYSYGYYWSSNWQSYGYQWNEPTWMSASNSWNPGTWMNAGYQWTPGQYTQNTWTYVPPGVWGSS